MNKLLIITLLLIISQYSIAQKAIFLHHSTGGAVYSEGEVKKWITDYNNAHSTNFEITERAYPNTPYPWDNYPYDFWNLWVNNNCNANESGTECLESLCSKYQVIIFKHCFPGAGIGEDGTTSSVSSSRKSLGNYKLQYRALREKMSTFPNNKFIVWTLAPLHRLSTSDENAKRANEFVEWVKNEWLVEDGKSYPNIFIYDFYGIVAELEPNPAKGKTNCLKYDYENSHSDSDSHPNYAANKTAGPLFAQKVIDVFENKTTISVSKVSIQTPATQITIKGEKLQLTALVEPNNAANTGINWSIVSGNLFAEISSEGLLSPLANGIVEIKATSIENPNISATISIEILNQDLSVADLDLYSGFIKFDSYSKTYQITPKGQKALKVEVRSIDGKLVLRKTIKSDYTVPHLNKGVYVVSLIAENKHIIEKIAY